MQTYDGRTNPDARCTQCRKQLDGATGFRDGAKPKEGDLSICAYCGNQMRFNADLTLRTMTDEDRKTLPKQVLEGLDDATLLIRDYARKQGSK